MSAKKSLNSPFWPADRRGEDEESRTVRKGQDPADDLFAGLRGDRSAAIRAVALAEPGKEDAQEVRYLGYSADGRTRVAPSRFLLDANGRGEAADEIDIGFG